MEAGRIPNRFVGGQVKREPTDSRRGRAPKWGVDGLLRLSKIRRLPGPFEPLIRDTIHVICLLERR